MKGHTKNTDGGHGGATTALTGHCPFTPRPSATLFAEAELTWDVFARTLRAKALKGGD